MLFDLYCDPVQYILNIDSFLDEMYKLTNDKDVGTFYELLFG